MTRALLTAALLGALAATAAANPIDSDWWRESPPPPPPVAIAETPPAPPPKPAEPRTRSLGYRFNMMSMRVAGHDRTAAALSLQWGLTLTGELRAFADYDLLIVFGAGEGIDAKVRGRGHGLRAGLRYPLADHSFNKGSSDGELRMYADAETSLGAAYTSDDQVGTQVTPQATGGLRLGYEIRKRDDRDYDHVHAPRARYDGHVVIRAVATPGDVGFMFGVGMEWGS